MSGQSSMHRPVSPAPVISLGRDFCRAISHATGIAMVRSATIDGDADGVTLIRMEFVATPELLRLVGTALTLPPVKGVADKSGPQLDEAP